MSDDELIQSRLHHTNGLSILSLNCQSLQAKFDYIEVLIDKFCNSNHPPPPSNMFTGDMVSCKY